MEGKRVQGWLNVARPQPLVTAVLCGLNVVVFLISLGVTGNSSDADPYLRVGAEYGPLVFAGQWWRLFTAIFLHFGILHLAFNMVCLWQLGFVAEFLFGRARFVALYLLSGLGGSVLSLLVHPAIVSGGASGAIFGVAGGLGAFLLLHDLEFHSAKLTGLLPSLAMFIGYNLLLGFTQPGIDNAAHVGGLVVGAAMGGLMPRPQVGKSRLARLWFPLVAAAIAALIVYGAVRARREHGNLGAGATSCGRDIDFRSTLSPLCRDEALVRHPGRYAADTGRGVG